MRQFHLSCTDKAKLRLAGNVGNQGLPRSTVSVSATVAELGAVGQSHGLCDVGSSGKAEKLRVGHSSLDVVHDALVDLGQAVEVPATGSVVEDVAVATSVVLSKTHAADSVTATAPGEVGVRGNGVEGLADEVSAVVALVVVGLRLEEGDEDVGGVVEGQLEEPVVLGAKTSQPGTGSSLNEDTTLDGASGALVALVRGVVSDPRPEVVNVGGRTSSKVETQVGSLAVVLVLAVDGGVTGATNGVERVENSDITGVVTSHVDSEQNGTGERLVDGETDVLDVSNALLAGGATDLDNRGRVGLGRESTARSGNGRPGLTVQLGSGRDGDGGGDNVDTEGQVGNLALAGGGVESTLESSSVIGEAISLQGVSAVLAGVLQVDNVGNSLVGILGSVDDGVFAAGSKRCRPVHCLSSRVGHVDGVGTTGVAPDVGSDAGDTTDLDGTANDDHVGVGGVLGDVLNHEVGEAGDTGEEITRVLADTVDDSDPRVSRVEDNAAADGVTGRGEDADGVAAVNVDTVGAVSEGHALDLTLLVAIPVQTNVTEAEVDVGDGDGRSSIDEHTSVNALGHVNLDVNQSAVLGNGPAQSDETALAGDGSGVQNDVLDCRDRSVNTLYHSSQCWAYVLMTEKWVSPPEPPQGWLEPSP